MIRVVRVQTTDVHDVAWTSVVCDSCKSECTESRYFGAPDGKDIGWAGLSAMAGAESAGWRNVLTGRYQTWRCPKC